MTFPRAGALHFAGIGGAGMSAIAQVLLARGYGVSGCDLRESEATRRLRALGAPVSLGHDPAHLVGCDAVVASRAVPPGTPELASARARGLPVFHRAEALGAVMARGLGIAVAGTHGKTTTSAMTAAVLVAGGLDPTALVGAEVPALGGTARVGGGRHLVAEVDESDGSLHHVAPWAVVITSLDETDHMDHYRTLGALWDTFASFVASRHAEGFTVLCADYPHVLALGAAGTPPVRTYGLGDGDYRAEAIALEGAGSRFVVRRGAQALGEMRLAVPGRHNVQNALASLAVALELGVPFETAAGALARYDGVRRRFEVHADVGGITVVDDYAHNPVKVAAVLRAARESWPHRRIVAVFQPHRFTRTAAVGARFGPAFADADVVVITDIYPADESPMPGVTAAIIVDAVRAHRDAEYVAALDDVPDLLLRRLRPGDLVLTLGAGDVWRAASSLAGRLRAAGPSDG